MSQNVGEFVAERSDSTPPPQVTIPTPVRKSGRATLILSALSLAATAGMAAFLFTHQPIQGEVGPAGPAGPVNTTGGVCVSGGMHGYGYEWTVDGVTQAQDNNGVVSCAFGTYVPVSPIKVPNGVQGG